MTHMESIQAPRKVQPKWRDILYSQGRTLTWLGQATGISYPVVTAYAQGRSKPPEAWLDKVSDLLGEDVR